METKGGGEVRRIHVIYFLSRMGRIEQPHLIRVHHLTRNGVHLRDVKRWLSDLRGKEMPDSFSWSYKRRYKAGYVWQDLMDDDLISPISDNEYVLKGSDFSGLRFDSCSCEEKEGSILDLKLKQTSIKEIEEKPEMKIDFSTKSSQTDEDSGPLDSETTTDPVFSSTTTEIEEFSEEIEDSSCTENKKKSFAKSKSYSSGSSRMFRNLLSCGAVDTEDSVMMIKSKSYSSGSSSMFRNLLSCGAVDTEDSVMMINKSSKSDGVRDGDEICKVGTFGGSERIFGGGAWSQQQQKQNSRKSFSGGEKNSKKSSEFPKQKKVSSAYRRVPEPICSQCRKPFKPEKLYTHMKYCRGLKSLGKSSPSAVAGVDVSKKSTYPSSKETNSTYLLAH